MSGTKESIPLEEYVSSKKDNDKSNFSIVKYITILNWLPKYTRLDAVSDFVAGFSLGLTLIPQSIAYAALAGLTAQYGLYSCLMGNFLYLLFGTIKEVSIGPSSLMSLLTLEYTRNMSVDFVVLFCFLAGCIELLMGVLRLGEKQHNSGHTDSGFLSSGNLQISSELDDHELNIATAPVVPEPMRIDSGVDLDSSENLSQFTLKKVTLNVLTSNKVQVEPTVELTPVNTDKLVKNDVSTLRHESHQSSEKLLSDKSWQFFYTQNDDGDTLLHMAIIQGYMEATFNLIKMAPHSCLLDIQNDDGQTPLHLAVLSQQPKIVRRLILAGANPSLRSFRGNTPLHLACTTGDLASVKALLDPINSIEKNYFLAGEKIQILSQNLEQRNYNGQTCLHMAALSDQVELVRLLVHRGADLNAREGLAGRTALHLAMQYRCRSVVVFLLQECRFSLDIKTYRGETAYQLALHVDRQLARELVRLGAIPEPLPESDSNSSDEDESSAIICISQA